MHPRLPIPAPHLLLREEREYFPGQGQTALEEIGEKLYPHQSGTAVKCEFVLNGLTRVFKRGLKPESMGRDARCVNVCPWAKRGLRSIWTTRKRSLEADQGEASPYCSP